MRHPCRESVDVQQDDTDEHECGADEQENRHLHRRLGFRDPLGGSPDQHHDVGRYDNHFAKEQEEEEIAREKRARHACDEDEQQDEIFLRPMLDAPRREDCSNPHGR